MENTTKYWKGLEELEQSPAFVEANSRGEFAEELPVENLLNDSVLESSTPRRNFLKAMGFGMGAVTLAACNRTPVHKSIPYLVKPEEITPGVATYYTTTIKGEQVLVKTREGRPIKIEGNKLSPITKGGVSSRVQASVLDLYDNGRLAEPMMNGAATTWENVDAATKEALSTAASNSKQIRVLAASMASPSTQAVLDQFVAMYPNSKVITYDAVSNSAIINAHKNSFDKAVLPSYNFANADVIVGFNADFLGTWISPVEFTKQYVSKRNANYLRENRNMSKHVQFETSLSITGTKADNRVVIKPSQEGLAIAHLYNALASANGASSIKVADLPADKMEQIIATANLLNSAKGASIVVSGSNDVSVQILVNAINSLLGNYGKTVDIDNVSFVKQGNEAEINELIAEMSKGEVGAVMFYGTNPIYTLPKAAEFKAALAKVPFTLSFADRVDETAALCTVIAPDNHVLESWNDAMLQSGHYSIVQPTIAPVYNTRQAQALFLNLGTSGMNYYDFVVANWKNVIYPKSGASNFTSFWNKALQEGFATVASQVQTPKSYSFNKDLNQVADSINRASNVNGTELFLYESVNMGDGASANNPWLLELPDPISKVTWDNYVAISKKQAVELGIQDEDVVEVKAGNYSITLPAVIQPGQANGTISIALGWGRTAAGKAGNDIGKNAYPFIVEVNGSHHFATVVEITKTGETYPIARTQIHGSIEGRDIVRETTLSNYKEDPASGSQSSTNIHMYDLWDEHRKDGHHWGMAIDMNACTGCGACITSCNAENNVAVVGKTEVRRRREMHWIRIDRYYTFNAEGTSTSKEKEYNKLEDFENISVVHQPMMCQHCDHASCETVCPVLASMHSSEGLNQQVYNRCVGTRYCANNCAYKVRRFNWFNYADNNEFDFHMNNDLGKMVLNPDVTVRSRGVMEKCTFCVQRIQAGKLQARTEGKPLADGVVETACANACPANAITFGDINDPNSKVSQLLKNERTYYVLEEINTQPGVGYLTVVRNNKA
jgi:MoCo/4Fe-4S cofactor protein with predicted Tat translocation signal